MSLLFQVWFVCFLLCISNCLMLHAYLYIKHVGTILYLSKFCLAMLCPWSLLRNVMNKHGQRNTIRIIISNDVIFLLLLLLYFHLVVPLTFFYSFLTTGQYVTSFSSLLGFWFIAHIIYATAFYLVEIPFFPDNLVISFTMGF
jgi:hypothetical protein